MSKKLTKSDVQADKVTQELRKGFDWATHHTQIVVIGLAGFLLIGAGYSAYTYFNSKKEADIQEAYYLTERQYLDLKTKFEASEDVKKADAKVDPKAAPTPAPLKASGDLNKDYGNVVQGFSSVIEKSPNSKAARMAALTLADIYSSHNQKDQALQVLDKTKPESDLLSAMVLDRKATLKADLNDCKGAIALWDDVLKIKKSEFMASEIHLKKGLCFESLNDLTQAQAMYTQAKSAPKEGAPVSATSKTADKYLRLLESKKN